jgi:hypothetical protein
MNLDMKKNVNFNMILKNLCENTLDLDSKNGLSITIFGPP